MTKKEFILQFCIHNGCRLSLKRVIAHAINMAQELEKKFPQVFDNDDEQDRLTNAIEIALDHAQRDGGFAVQFNEKDGKENIRPTV